MSIKFLLFCSLLWSVTALAEGPLLRVKWVFSFKGADNTYITGANQPVSFVFMERKDPWTDLWRDAGIYWGSIQSFKDPDFSYNLKWLEHEIDQVELQRLILVNNPTGKSTGTRTGWETDFTYVQTAADGKTILEIPMHLKTSTYSGPFGPNTLAGTAQIITCGGPLCFEMDQIAVLNLNEALEKRDRHPRLIKFSEPGLKNLISVWRFTSKNETNQGYVAVVENVGIDGLKNKKTYTLVYSSERQIAAGQPPKTYPVKFRTRAGGEIVYETDAGSLIINSESNHAAAAWEDLSGSIAPPLYNSTEFMQSDLKKRLGFYDGTVATFDGPCQFQVYASFRTPSKTTASTARTGSTGGAGSVGRAGSAGREGSAGRAGSDASVGIRGSSAP